MSKIWNSWNWQTKIFNPKQIVCPISRGQHFFINSLKVYHCWIYSNCIFIASKNHTQNTDFKLCEEKKCMNGWKQTQDWNWNWIVDFFATKAINFKLK